MEKPSQSIFVKVMFSVVQWRTQKFFFGGGGTFNKFS